MNNKTVIIIVLISLGVFIIFGVLAGIGMSQALPLAERLNYNYDGDAITYTENEHAELDSVNVIDISVVSSNITFSESESGLDAVLDMRTLSEKEKWTLSVEQVGEVLYVKIEHPKLSMTSAWASLSVALPSDFDGEIIVHSTSADIKGNLNNTLESLDVRTVSGDCELSFKSVDRVKLDSTSGTFEINADITSLLDAGSTSGELIIQNLASADAQVMARTVSGRIELSYTEACETTVQSTSGDVKISVPENTPVQMLFNSTSGNMRGNVNINKDGVLFDIKTVSGDLSFD